MVTGVGNPSTAGGYGPFKIVTRHSAAGQIQDANYVYGSVGIAPAVLSISNFGLAYASSSTGAINAASQTINFTFTIT